MDEAIDGEALAVPGAVMRTAWNSSSFRIGLLGIAYIILITEIYSHDNRNKFPLYIYSRTIALGNPSDAQYESVAERWSSELVRVQDPLVGQEHRQLSYTHFSGTQDTNVHI